MTKKRYLLTLCSLVVATVLLSVSSTGARIFRPDGDTGASLTAGDGLTRTADDFDCDTADASTLGCLAAADFVAFSITATDTITNINAVPIGSWDFGGATSVEIPNGAAPTVNAQGEIALDTTNAQIVYYSSGSEQVLSATSLQKAINILTPAGGNKVFFKADSGYTLTAINCLVDPTDTTGVNVEIDLWEADADGDSTSTIASAITCANTNTAGTITNSSIDKNDYIGMTVLSVSGSPATVSVNVWGKTVRE